MKRIIKIFMKYLFVFMISFLLIINSKSIIYSAESLGEQATEQSETIQQNWSETNQNQSETKTINDSETAQQELAVEKNSSSTQFNDVLKIDDTNTYQGMVKAYKDGYEPTIENGLVRIVIPLVEQTPSDIQEITVTPNLGDIANSPFIYKNYQKTFLKTSELINGTETAKEVFLIQYELPLKEKCGNGTYSVIFHTSMMVNHQMITKDFTVYIKVDNGTSDIVPNETVIHESETNMIESNMDIIDNGGGDIIGDGGMSGGDIGISNGGTSEKEEKPKSQPKIIISKCEADTERIESGSEFTLKVTLKNTNKNFYVQNMTVDVSWTEPGLELEEDSKTIFVEKLGSEKTLEIPLKFKVGSNVAQGRYDITFNMAYDNPEAASMNSTGTVSINIYQAMRAELEVGKFPDEVNAGDNFEIGIQAMNLGRGMIYNAKCTIDVPGLSVNSSVFFGNIEAAQAANSTMKIFAGKKDEAIYGSSYGSTEGTVTLTYEDAEGHSFSQSVDVYTQVNALSMTPVQPEEKDENQIGIQWYVGIGVIIILVIVGIILLIRRKRRVKL